MSGQDTDNSKLLPVISCDTKHLFVHHINNSVATMLLYCCYGVAVVLLWCYYGVAMMLLWCCCVCVGVVQSHCVRYSEAEC